MEDLIEALQLMATRCKPEYPTHCEHDVLTVCVSPKLFTVNQLRRLSELGFSAEFDEDCFTSFRFGSA